jgi:hypothetical protein
MLKLILFFLVYLIITRQNQTLQDIYGQVNMYIIRHKRCQYKHLTSKNRHHKHCRYKALSTQALAIELSRMDAS